jgi:uncharacterized protein YdiU (UPF0061 family)
MARPLDDVTFDDGFVRALPGDPSDVPGPRQVRGACFSLVTPTPVRAPTILAWSDDAAALLGVERPPTDDGVVAEVLGGNRVLPGMRPFAACYGGHQFGVWAGQLGDGRAISLTELIAPDGRRWEVQLKGAGPTPYSRNADGRAVLRSSIREFLCSEAMHHLGVPTTRALALVATGEQVMRDMFYDGRPRAEPGAIVTRLAPSFVRFGNFELANLRGDRALVRTLADHVITVHYPELGPPSPAVYARWFTEICRRTAVMIAHWMRLGFVHGVMNTDNMSILGLTLDYGPYGWLDTYSRDFTPNTTDLANGRYRFGNQPGIARWNLAHLARSIVDLVDDQDALVAGLDVYRDTFERTYQAMMGEKLGLTFVEGEDEPLLAELLAILEAEETDMTIFFRRLAHVPVDSSDRPDAELLAPLELAFYGELPAAHRARVARWLRRYATRVDREPGEPGERRVRMDRVNPVVILRNYLVQEAIDQAEAGDPARVLELLDAARRPYDDRPEYAVLFARRPDWARDKAGCSALSCSS